MQITVTGCNNCPFRASYHARPYCVLDKNSSMKTYPIISIDVNYRTDIPTDCPITLNGGTITITTKSE